MIKDDYETPFRWVANALVALGNTPTGINHLPWVLYHCLVSYDVKNTLASSALWLTHYTKQADIASTEFNMVHIAWPLPKRLPRVSILIPTRDRVALLSRCIDTLRNTDYPDIEWIIIDNDSREEATHDYFAQLKDEGVKIIPYAGSFNFSAMNNHAVAFATGEVVALVNNDVELLHPQWLTAMIRELMRPDVGIVGAKLLWENDMVQHAGVLLGLHSLAGHIGNDWHNDDLGYFGLNQHVRGVSAVTAACLLCRREDYLQLNGLNATELMVNFNDVDFCLRMQETLHKRVIWTPHARLRHLESASRGKEQRPAEQARTAREMRYMRVSWASVIASDPYYNPNLNFDRYSHAGLSFPPRN
jgi:GT2 family glycosyltransferase